MHKRNAFKGVLKFTLKLLWKQFSCASVGNEKSWYCLLYFKLYPFVDRQGKSVQKISFGIRAVTCRMPPVSLLFVGKWYPVLMRQLVQQDRKAGSLAHSTRRTVSLVTENKFVEAVQSCVHIRERTCCYSVNAPCTGEVQGLILVWRTVYRGWSFCVFFSTDPTRIKQFQTFSCF